MNEATNKLGHMAYFEVSPQTKEAIQAIAQKSGHRVRYTYREALELGIKKLVRKYQLENNPQEAGV